MEFADFAAAHGLIIKSLDIGRWARVPTVDHPRSKNGAYFFDRDYGFCQNWAEMQEVAVWHDKAERTPFDQAALNARMEAARKAQAKERAAMQRQAANKASFIIDKAKQEQHAYLDSKGFKDALGLVWYPDKNTNLLVIPMRHNGALAGCQLIDRDGQKRFLKGQRTNDCEHVIGAAGFDISCEGYATGLSIWSALRALNMPCRVHVCFSAWNLQRMAKSGFVVADNDASGVGEKSAIATGLPYWIPAETGLDFNDYYVARGKFAAGMDLRKSIYVSNGARTEPYARETKAVRA